MTVVKDRLALAAFVCVLIAAPSATYARVRVGVGIGVHLAYGPHYGWCDPWYDPWHHHLYGPTYDCDPIYIGLPVVVERHVVVHEPSLPRQPAALPSPTLSEAQQQRRSEMLKRLRIGDVNARVEAARSLTGFVGDDKTREALEKAIRSDRDAAVRKAAVKALAKQGGKKAVPALKQAYADDADRDVRQAAYKALIMIEGY